MTNSYDAMAELSQLGQSVPIPATPDAAYLEAISFPNDDHALLVRLSCPEFTSVCPVTGQPDFAHFVIDYVPNGHLIESKSLKLFMASFRSHAAFHEQVTAYIGQRLLKALQPAWLRVNAYWFPRGGIPIDVFWEHGDKPDKLHVPLIDIPTYRAR